MKILSLRLSNLASIAGEQHIDFEQEPLKTAGLIAITGITGAGKTTLLDAICLALFDQVPRLQHAEANKKILDASGDDIQVNSTVNSLRRGCVQGFAEVEFIAQDHKQYLARWEVKRARLKANGRMQPVLRTLRCISDDQLISEQAKECNKRIIELLGLDFKQFTRAVLLAQSEVTAFLKAKDNERADLLEYLTNSDIYSRIGMASFAATKQAREKVEAIEKKMGDHLPLSDEERQNLVNDLNTAQQQLHELEQQQQQLQKDKEWYHQQQQLAQHVSQQQQRLNEAQQQHNQFAPQAIFLKQLEQFEPIRASFVQQQQLVQQQDAQLKTKQQVQQDTQSLAKQLELQQQHYHQQQQVLSNLQQQHQQLKPQLQAASQCEHTLKHLNELIGQQQGKLDQNSHQLAPTLNKQHAKQQQQDQLNTALTQQQTILQQSRDFAAFDAEPQAAIATLKKAATLRIALQQQQTDIFNTDIATQQAQLDRLNQQLAQLVQLHGSIDSYEQQLKPIQMELEGKHKHLSSCERIGDQLKQWLKIEQSLCELQQQQQTEQQQLAPLQQILQQAQQTTQQAQIQLKTTQKLLREQRLLTAQSAKDLREQLKPEQPCMVCGSTKHPFYDPKNLINALNQQLDQQEQQAELALQQAQEQQAKQQVHLTKLQSSIDQLIQRQQHMQQDKQSVLDEINQISPKFYQKLNGKFEIDHANQILQGIQDKIRNEKIALEQQCKQQQTDLKAWQLLDKQQNQQQNLLNKYQELLSIEQQTVAQLNEARQQQWQHHCDAAHHEFIDNIDKRSQANKQLNLINEQKIEVQQTLIQLGSEIAHLQQQHAQIQQQLQAHKDQQLHTQQQLKGLFEHYAAPFQVGSSADWQQQLEQQAQQQQQRLEQLSQQLKMTDTNYTKQQHQLEHLEHDLAKNQNLLARLSQDIEQWQQQQLQDAHKNAQQSDSNTTALENIEKLLQCNHAQKQQLQQQQDHLQKNLQLITNTLAVYEQQYQQHVTQQPLLEQAALAQALLELTTAKQQLDEQCTALKLKKLQDEQQQQQSTHYIAQLEKAKAEHHRWNKISSLIGDAKGATFKKLAQQFHLQMLVELANQQLVALTPRYELRCIEDSLGLTIVDHFMNDEMRPVLSLSGGESFLVSLALALGIANMASGTTKLESLFIDEGFGTLDQSSLHIVMDALDRLQSQGRKVILISHIADMHERIPVKIQVMPQGSGASKIEVVG